MSHFLRALIVLALVLITGCGGGGGYTVGPLFLGTDVVVADVDGDGRADVITLTYRYGDQPVGGRVSVYRQDAAGRYPAPESYVVGCYPWSVTVADIDGDGLADLVVTDVGGYGCTEAFPGNAIFFLRQDPTHPGHFLAARKLIDGVKSYQVAVGDFNADGAPDIVTGGWLGDSKQLLVLLQDPKARGTFKSPLTIPMPGSVYQIVAGDIDGDGRSDLFFHMYLENTGYTPNSTLAMMRQLAGGTWGPVVSLAAQTGLNVQRLAITDVNSDGRVDLLAHFTPFSTDYRPKLTVLLQSPAPAAPLTWSAPVDSSLQGIDGTSGTAFGDLNGDGQPDVVLAGSFPTGSAPLSYPDIASQANVIIRTGLAGYRLASSIGLPNRCDQVAIGDIDGDGRNDIVLFDGAEGLRVMLQSRTVAGSFGAPQPLP